jgi:hypothetical protein
VKINKDKFKKGEIKVNPTTMELMEECGIFQQFVQAGKADGMFAAKADAIISILTERLETPPMRLQERIRNVRSIEKLDELIRFAATCVSIGEFSTALE